MYKSIEAELVNLHDKYKDHLVHNDEYPQLLEVPSLSLSYDLSLLNDHPLLEKENEVAFLASLRSIFSKVSSAASIAMIGNEVSIHMKEDCDLKVVVEQDANHAIALKSATVAPLVVVDP